MDEIKKTEYFFLVVVCKSKSNQIIFLKVFKNTIEQIYSIRIQNKFESRKDGNNFEKQLNPNAA